MSRFTEQTATPGLDSLAEEIARLRYAAELLEQLYIDIGPYQDRALAPFTQHDSTWRKVRDFFDFDDSE